MDHIVFLWNIRVYQGLNIMSVYTPSTIIYYGIKGDNNYRLTPAPDFDINIEYQYSNDTIIGYVYTITLNGNATALDLSNVNYNTSYDPNTVSSGDIGGVVDHINKLRKILNQNGNILYVINGSNNNTILRAKGGKLRSINFDESSNNWTHYAPYTATIEFDSVDFGSENDSCNSFLDPLTFSDTDYGLINLNKFKINSFSDSWSFSFDENESFERGLIKGTKFNNSSFTLTYNINAVGKHYYDYSTPNTNSSTKILSAWEQAKNFVQHRLYYQVTNLTKGILKNSYTVACSGGDTLADLYTPGNQNGLLSDLYDKIYNETITCEISESDGSFSATYNAIIKTNDTDTAYGSAQTKHSIQKKHSIDNSSLAPIHTISLEGTIQGLVEGGLINSSKPIELPDKGLLFIHKTNSYVNKYDNALSVLNKIYSPNDYNNGIGDNGKRDLKPAFKNLLDITSTALQSPSSPSDPLQDPPHPTSFNLTHDYLNGSITYSVEYQSNSNACGRKYKNINIETNMPTKIIAVFNIPNSNSCPVIQDLGTYTAKTVSISIEGIDLSENGQPASLNLNNLINCGSCFSDGYFPVTIPNGSIITDKTYTYNPLDGSFTANLSYICAEGCDI
jgi:hypothetical protein